MNRPLSHPLALSSQQCGRAIGIRLGYVTPRAFHSAKGGLYSEWITEVPKLRPLVFLRVGLGMDGAGRGLSRQVAIMNLPGGPRGDGSGKREEAVGKGGYIMNSKIDWLRLV